MIPESRTNAIDAEGNPVRPRTALTASSTRELKGETAGACPAPTAGCNAMTLSRAYASALRAARLTHRLIGSPRVVRTQEI
jgi:hypothetical protein